MKSINKAIIHHIPETHMYIYTQTYIHTHKQTYTAPHTQIKGLSYRSVSTAPMSSAAAAVAAATAAAAAVAAATAGHRHRTDLYDRPIR